MLAFSAADFEDFVEPRPDLAPAMEADLEAVVRHLAERRLAVPPARHLRRIDHAVSRRVRARAPRRADRPAAMVLRSRGDDHVRANIERVKALGGGIAIQHRMAFQGEHFVDRYGAQQRPNTRRRSGACSRWAFRSALGTDATRVASYNPWVALSWLVTGTTVGGLTLYPEENRLDRETALRLFTRGSAWMSREDDVKGRIAPGQYADFAALSADYFSVPDTEIRDIVRC